MKLLNWNDEKMGLGIKIIDEQHKKLLDIINQLSYTINQNSQKQDISIIIDKLIDYVQYHFSTEEQLFQQYQNEQFEKHQQDHKKFTQKFISIKNKITNDKVYSDMSALEITEEIFIILTNWFIAHVAGSDRKLILSLKEQNLL